MPSPRQARHWVQLVSLHSCEGQCWAREYFAAPLEELRVLVARSLSLLRLREIAQAEVLLGRLDTILDKLDGRASIEHVLERDFYGALAYYYYCIEDYVAASASLDLVTDSIRAAIAQDCFLLPFAQECPDVPHQKIRIARNQRLWRDMAHYVQVEREMLTSSRPLCTLSDGAHILYMDIEGYYRAIEGVDGSHCSHSALIVEQTHRTRAFVASIEALYVDLGSVIPYTWR